MTREINQWLKRKSEGYRRKISKRIQTNLKKSFRPLIPYSIFNITLTLTLTLSLTRGQEYRYIYTGTHLYIEPHYFYRETRYIWIFRMTNLNLSENMREKNFIATSSPTTGKSNYRNDLITTFLRSWEMTKFYNNRQKSIISKRLALHYDGIFEFYLKITLQQNCNVNV